MYAIDFPISVRPGVEFFAGREIWSTYRARIDTGAMRSLVSAKCVEEMQLQENGSIPIRTFKFLEPIGGGGQVVPVQNERMCAVVSLRFTIDFSADELKGQLPPKLLVELGEAPIDGEIAPAVVDEIAGGQCAVLLGMDFLHSVHFQHFRSQKPLIRPKFQIWREF